MAALTKHMDVPEPGMESQPHLRPIPQLHQCQIFNSTVLGWGLNQSLHNLNHYSQIFYLLCPSRDSLSHLFNVLVQLSRVFQSVLNWFHIITLFFFPGPHLYYTEVPRLARGPIGAAAAGLHHTHRNARSEPYLSHIYDLCCNLKQHQILNPLSKVRVRTCLLKDTIRSLIFCATISLTFILFKELPKNGFES